MTQPAILAKPESAKQIVPLLPGLSAASYPSGDLLDQPDELDALYQQRKRYNREFGFCLFTAECVFSLAALCKGKKVLEAGSGSGWLADRLAQQGIEITAADWTDYRQPRDTKRGYPMRSVFRLDHHGDAAALLPGNFDVVLLVWPNLGTPFGEQVARAMRSGQVMIFIKQVINLVRPLGLLVRGDFSQRGITHGLKIQFKLLEMLSTQFVQVREFY